MVRLNLKQLYKDLNKVIDKGFRKSYFGNKELNKGSELLKIWILKMKNSLSDKSTIENRIELYKIISRYFKENLNPCLVEKDNKLYLQDTQGNDAINFDKQIGSESMNAVAYLNSGTGNTGKIIKSNLLSFSCKIMDAGRNKSPNLKEIKILDKMTEYVLKKYTPNFPITYLTLHCDKKCEYPNCPEYTKKSGYYIVLNELANEDLRMWLKNTYTNEEYNSIFLQIILSVYAFHNMGFYHNDLHLGNFLIHKVKPGGFWHYKISDIDIYVKNMGYLLVIWDPGYAESKSKVKYEYAYLEDYYKTFMLMSYIGKYETEDIKGLQLSKDIQDKLQNIRKSVNSEAHKIPPSIENDNDVALFCINSIYGNDAPLYVGRNLKLQGYNYVKNNKPYLV